MFSDEYNEVTDKIFSPENSIETAKTIYETFQQENPWKGGDFIRTFFFNQNIFTGKVEEVERTIEILRKIRKTVNRGEVPLLHYVLERKDGTPSLKGAITEKELEYALVRLIHIGVIFDYTKDYNAKTFDISVAQEWLDAFSDEETYRLYLLSRYQEYLRRYEVLQRSGMVEGILNATDSEVVEYECCKAMVDYVYDSIERKRRQASRTMLELARKGARDPEGFRRDLMLYLQASERFTHHLEDLARVGPPQKWRDLVSQTTGEDEIRELHGACQRILESFPTDPGLLAISAVSRLDPTSDEIERSSEDFKASLVRWEELFNQREAADQGHLLCDLASRINFELGVHLLKSFGHWLLDRDLTTEVVKYLGSDSVRIRWVNNITANILSKIPNPNGE